MRLGKFAGLHAHIGSQIFDSNGYLSEIDVLTDIVRKINEKLNIETEELNIGGGIGISILTTTIR